MSFIFNTIPATLDKILVIDDMPLVSLAFQEIFRKANTAVTVEYTDNIFTALSSRAYENNVFDLVIVGSLPDTSSENIRVPVTELQQRFGKARIMLYAVTYDPGIIEKMEESGIYAYVHKYEPPEEIRQVYSRLSAGESYISEIFRTLYYEYGLDLVKFRARQSLPVTVTDSQKNILLLLCQGKTVQQIAGILAIPASQVADELNLFSAALS